jgi:hypothetical protein
MKQRYHDDNDLLQDYASAHLPRVHDGTGDSGLAMHRPGFRVTDAPLSDALQRAYDAYAFGCGFNNTARSLSAGVSKPKVFRGR